MYSTQKFRSCFHSGSSRFFFWLPHGRASSLPCVVPVNRVRVSHIARHWQSSDWKLEFCILSSSVRATVFSKPAVRQMDMVCGLRVETHV